MPESLTELYFQLSPCPWVSEFPLKKWDFPKKLIKVPQNTENQVFSAYILKLEAVFTATYISTQILKSKYI